MGYLKNGRFSITVRQAKDLDLKAEQKFAIPLLLLMENAGQAVSAEALKVIKDKNASVAVFCGRGNNGGDGFCAARHLLAQGIKPDIYLAGKVSEVKKEAGINLEILLRLKEKIFEVNPSNFMLLKRKIKKYQLIIDALVGVGLRAQVTGILEDLIKLINNSGAYILSVDIPSGLQADSGRVLGCCIRADKTVTFVAPKIGMLTPLGRKFCGEIVIKEIGIPH